MLVKHFILFVNILAGAAAGVRILGALVYTHNTFLHNTAVHIQYTKEDTQYYTHKSTHSTKSVLSRPHPQYQETLSLSRANLCTHMLYRMRKFKFWGPFLIMRNFPLKYIKTSKLPLLRKCLVGLFSFGWFGVCVCVWVRVRACVRALVRACVRACVRTCMRVCVKIISGGPHSFQSKRTYDNTLYCATLSA